MPLPPIRPWRPALRLGLLVLGLGLTTGCVPTHPQASWRLFPLPRQQPHDGLAVVSQPDGYGLHIFLTTDTSQAGVCRPRWTPDAARLFNGNGSAPFSSGTASREEFFTAMARGPVRTALRQELEALCHARAPQRQFVWTEPPRSATDLKPAQISLLEEPHLLSHPNAVKRAEKQLLGEPLDPADLRDAPRQEEP